MVNQRIIKSPAWLKQPPKNIIVRMPNWLGDLVMATPVIEDLRHHWKDAKITALCQSNVAPLMQEDPHLDEILSFRKPSGWIHRLRHLELVTLLQTGHFDLGILLTNSFSSAWWFWRGKVKNRVGYSTNFRSELLNLPVPFPKELETQHLTKTYKMLLEPLGIPLSDSTPRLYSSAEEINEAAITLKRLGANIGENIIVGINPGAAYGSAKCWLPERFREVAIRLIQDPRIRVVFFGDPTGTPLVNEICKDMPSQVINLAGKTMLRELIALIRCCDAFLTNDSGPMHMASALHVPLVALFGSTSDVKTGPLNGTVIHKRVECSPCYRRTCPIDFRCMKRIESDEVYQELLKILKAK